MTILVPQTKTAQPAEKLSLSWFFPLENWKLPNMFGPCFCFLLFFIIIFYVAAGVCTNRITRRAAQPCFRYSWYHIATACQLFDNEVEAWFWWLMGQWGKVEKERLLLKEKERERRKALIPRRLWKWLQCDFRLIMRIMLLLDNKSSMIWFIFSKNLYQYLIDYYGFLIFCIFYLTVYLVLVADCNWDKYKIYLYNIKLISMTLKNE